MSGTRNIGRSTGFQPVVLVLQKIGRTRAMVKSGALMEIKKIIASLRSGISVGYDRSSRRAETTCWKPVLRKTPYFHA